jgi:hypothetical protein
MSSDMPVHVLRSGIRDVTVCRTDDAGVLAGKASFFGYQLYRDVCVFVVLSCVIAHARVIAGVALAKALLNAFPAHSSSRLRASAPVASGRPVNNKVPWYNPSTVTGGVRMGCRIG